jgi:hypothetical protein
MQGSQNACRDMTSPLERTFFLQKRLYRLFRDELVHQDIEFSSKRLTLIGEGVFLEGGSLRLERRAATCRTWLGQRVGTPLPTLYG